MMSQKRRTVADEPFLIVRTAASDVPAGTHFAEHAHDWHQLVYAGAGLLAVDTDQGSWLAPPSWSVWIPAHVRHSLRFVGASRFRTIYIRPDSGWTFPARCLCLAASPLLREAVMRACETGMLDERDRIEHALATLIFGELDRPGPPPFALPQPSSIDMSEAARLLMEGRMTSLPQVARVIGLGLRTFERRFRAETGLSPGRWQRQWRLLAGLEHIAAGGSVKGAARVSGFASSSAYVAAFGAVFGTTPGKYFS